METYKILHLIDSAGMYGAEKVVLNLLRELKNTTFPGILGCIRENKLQQPQIAIEAEAQGIEVEYFTMKRGLNIYGTKRIINYINKNNIRIIHSHGYKSNILFGVLPNKNFKLISTVHGWSKTSAGIKGKVYELLDSWSLKRADQIVAVSKGVIHDLVKTGLNKENITLIYNGINIEDNVSNYDTTNLRKKYGLGNDDYVIGTIGRLSKVKGHISLIKAMPSIQNTIENCKLIIAGEGALREGLSTLINKYDISDDVQLIGYVQNIYEILSIIDIFVLPSLSEGLPISLLETMNYGKPIVASNVGGIPEVILNNRNGILFPPDEPDSLSESIIKMYTYKDLAKNFVKYNKQLVEDKFTSKKMAMQYSDLYSTMLSGDCDI